MKKYLEILEIYLLKYKIFSNAIRLFVGFIFKKSTFILLPKHLVFFYLFGHKSDFFLLKKMRNRVNFWFLTLLFLANNTAHCSWEEFNIADVAPLS